MSNSAQQSGNEPQKYCSTVDYSGKNRYVQRDKRPHISYAELITMAIEDSSDAMLTLKEIYAWISDHYPYFNTNKTGWQNSIRHNLSLNRCFFKVPRAEGNRGKGSYWKINYEFQNVKVNYRVRKYDNKPAEDQRINSLTQILNDNTLIRENIGVNEIPYKPTTVFNGNLMEDEYYNQPEFYETREDKHKMDRIFSFK